MVEIYKLMKSNWEAYSLMSAIIYIEEMSKPTKHTQIKYYKDKNYVCTAFHGVRLKMNNPEIINKFFNMTKKWEKEK